MASSVAGPDRRRLLAVCALALTFSSCRKAELIPGTDIVLSHETAALTSPLLPDGTPDYAAALNAKGAVAPEANVAAILAQVLGPATLEEAVFRRLGVTRPAGGPSFITQEEAAGRWSGGNMEPLRQEVLQLALRRAWTDREAPLTARWLDANAEALAQLEAAAGRPRFWLPLYEGRPVPELAVPSLMGYREAGTALTARAMRRLGTGDADGAAADLLSAVRLGSRLEQGEMLLSSLLGTAMRSTAAEALPALAASRHLSPASAHRVAAEVRGLTAFPRLPEQLGNERYAVLAGAVHLARAGAKASNEWVKAVFAASTPIKDLRPFARIDPAAFDWNETLRGINATFDAAVRAYRTGPVSGMKQLLAAPQPEPADVSSLAQAAGSDRQARLALSRQLGSALVGTSFARAALAPLDTIGKLRIGELLLEATACRDARGHYPAECTHLATALQGASAGGDRDGLRYTCAIGPGGRAVGCAAEPLIAIAGWQASCADTATATLVRNTATLALASGRCNR